MTYLDQPKKMQEAIEKDDSPLAKKYGKCKVVSIRPIIEKRG